MSSAIVTEAHIGRKATSKNVKGIIRFVGETEFGKGVWVGLELFAPTGIQPSVNRNLCTQNN